MYTLLLNELIIPETLSNFSSFKELVSKLNVDNLPNSMKDRVICSIIKSMESISVPSFYIKNNKRGLYDSFGAQVGENYNFSIEQGQQNIINRIHNMSEQDLYFQTSIKEDSIKAFLHASSPLQFKQFELRKCRKPDGCVYWNYLDGYADSRKELELGGFAHGSSSAAAILYEAYEFTRNNHILSLAQKTLHHDRSFFSPEIKGWIDGRNTEQKLDGGSWCHGAAGVAVSRLLLYSHIPNDKLILNELEVSFNQMQKVMGGNICICHGMAGNLEVMYCISNIINNKSYRTIVNDWLYTLVDRVLNNEPLICGDDSDRELYGLFMGLSGLGYQFLRFYDWKNIPSLLFLETIPKVATFHYIAEAEKLIE